MTPVTGTEMVDATVVKAEVVEYLGGVIEEAQAIAAAVKDDTSAELAANLGVRVKEKLVWLESRREKVYVPLYRAAEGVRREFDDPIKLGKQIEKTLSSAVIKYRLDKKREEDRLRLQAEAEAKKIREEAERKEREAEAERQRIIKEQEARELRRREEAAAEERRVQAEAKAKEDAERARLQREQDERSQRIKEEENARLAQAQEAKDVGLEERVDPILERPTAIAPVAQSLPTKDELEAQAEAQRKSEEAERDAERKRLEAKAEEERLRAEESERMRKLNEDAERAKADADAADAMAASQVSVSALDDRLRTNTTAKYEIPDLASFLKVAKAVAEGRAPAEFLGFDADHPEKFRASAIGKYVTKIKNDPDFNAKKAELMAIGIRAWLEESGVFKTENNGKEVA